MTENFSTGDILQLQDTNCSKNTGNTLSTVLGIIGALVVLSLIWNAYTRARDTRANTEAIASGAIGSLTSTVNGTQEELRSLARFERQDALKIAYTDGVLFGNPFYGGDDYGHGYGRKHGHGCGGDCQHQQFREIRTFAETADNIEVINTCGSLKG